MLYQVLQVQAKQQAIFPFKRCPGTWPALRPKKKSQSGETPAPPLELAAPAHRKEKRPYELDHLVAALNSPLNAREWEAHLFDVRRAGGACTRAT